jgi:osmotically-inducible protein OsmY
MNFTRLTALLMLPFLLGGCASPLVFGGAVAGGVTVANDRRTVGSIVDDEGIELKAAAALAKDPDISKKAHINVTSFNGIVLLTGEAPNPALRARATAIVGQLDRVKRVQNEVTLGEPSSVGSRADDTWITTKLKSKLLTNKDVEGMRVKVVTEKGTVFLMGIVTRRTADGAVHEATNTNGVKRVIKMFEYLD